MPAMNQPASGALPRSVVVIGLVSLLNDFASEMVIPLIPILLVTVLAAGPVALGLIEGTADAVSNLLKLWAGRRSDLFGGRRKPFIVTGYLLSNIARPFIGLSASWTNVLTIRVTDRIGKGLRTAPRDALITDVVDRTGATRAFGFARALDHSGAVLGALAAAAVLHWGTQRLDLVIALSAIPGLLAVGLIVFGIKESPRPSATPRVAPPLRWSLLGQDTRRFLLLLTLFAAGRIPETFVLLYGHFLGMDVVSLLLLWAGMHVLKALVSEIAGRQANRVGRHRLILAGWGIYALALGGLAFSMTIDYLWLFSLLLACYYGLTEAAERAQIGDLAPDHERGTAFGWYHMLTGSAAIPAGAVLGGIWALYGGRAAFLVSASIAVACAFLLRKLLFPR